MNCPKCQSRAKVQRAISRRKGTCIVRYLTCGRCANEFKSYEFLALPDCNLPRSDVAIAVEIRAL